MMHTAPRSHSTKAVERRNRNTPNSPQRDSAATASAKAIALQRALADPEAASPEAILRLQRVAGNRAVSSLLDGSSGDTSHDTPRIQFKLTVGPAGDEYEQEANRLASEVMRMPDPAGDPLAVEPAEAPGQARQKRARPAIAPVMRRALPHDAGHHAVSDV
jgi:hypothetical protein